MGRVGGEGALSLSLAGFPRSLPPTLEPVDLENVWHALLIQKHINPQKLVALRAHKRVVARQDHHSYLGWVVGAGLRGEVGEGRGNGGLN